MKICPPNTNRIASSSLRDVALSFKAPEFYPDALSLMSRGAASVGLGLLAAPAALVPLIETGLGKDSVYCQGLVEAMQSAYEQTKSKDNQ